MSDSAILIGSCVQVQLDTTNLATLAQELPRLTSLTCTCALPFLGPRTTASAMSCWGLLPAGRH